PPSAAGCPWSASTRSTCSKVRTARQPSPTSSRGAGSSSSTTSCSAGLGAPLRGLLIVHRQHRQPRPPPCPRHHDGAGLPSPAVADPTPQGAHGLVPALVLVERVRLQRRLRRHHRGR